MRGTQQFRENRKRKRTIKLVLLTAAAITAAVCGSWLLLSPKIEREQIADIQDAMIEDIMRDINGAENLTDETGGYTEQTDIEETEEITPPDGINNAGGYGDFEDEPVITPAYYPPVIGDPVPDDAFPENVTGIGILTVESIDLRLPIAEGIEEKSLRIAPGRVPQTAQVGEIGNAVIAGHRNYAFGSMFNRLGEMEIGDIVQYQARNGEMMEFEVFEIAVIEPEDQIAFIQPTDESIITLYTCTPVREATHRLIIRARRVSRPNNNEGSFEIEYNHE